MGGYPGGGLGADRPRGTSSDASARAVRFCPGLFAGSL